MNAQVGLVLSADYIPINQLIEFSPMLDQLGYSQVSVPEIWGHDAITLITALAQHTKSIKLASGIISMFSRTPALTAMTAASLDELSRGRFILGLGLSGPKVIENLHGQKFIHPIQRTREFVQILRTLFNKERINLNSSLLGDLRDFRLSFRKINPKIPIHIAALGPKNIELTAEIADGWIPVVMPLSAYKEQVQVVREHLSRLKKDKTDFSITPFVLSIIGDSVEKMELLRGHLSYYFGGMGDFYNNMLQRSGFADEAKSIKEHFLKGDILAANKAVSDDLIASTCVFGSKDEAQERLIQFIKAGSTCPLLSLPFRSNQEFAVETFQTLAPNNLSL
ncbi:MAG: LLM class flavin-dependent oxidoreductase [Candidatus Kariarchaeaceae archaeon]|jgi:F420-dependent oxidoreductase-like protein